LSAPISAADDDAHRSIPAIDGPPPPARRTAGQLPTTAVRANRLGERTPLPLEMTIMRTDLDHLPPHKQRELERVVKIIFEEFQDLVALTGTAWKKQGRIDKVILYGSYARGGWVDEPHTAKGYRSDFDILIIVNKDKLTDRVANWLKLEDRLNRELAITETLKTPVNFIVHTLSQVNDALAHGRYFFMDIAKDGIALYQFDDTELHQPKPKTPQQALKMAEEYFGEWFPASMRRSEFFRFGLEKGHLKETAFELHQVTESLYNCVLLVCTFYVALCRARHNGVYAERWTMPNWRGQRRLSVGLRVIGSA